MGRHVNGNPIQAPLPQKKKKKRKKRKEKKKKGEEKVEKED